MENKDTAPQEEQLFVSNWATLRSGTTGSVPETLHVSLFWDGGPNLARGGIRGVVDDKVFGYAWVESTNTSYVRANSFTMTVPANTTWVIQRTTEVWTNVKYSVEKFSSPIQYVLEYTFFGTSDPQSWRIDASTPLPIPRTGEEINVVAPHTNFSGVVGKVTHDTQYISGPQKLTRFYTHVIIGKKPSATEKE